MSVTTTVLVLLALLVALNSLAMIGVVRQVGLLHLRLKPVQALKDEDGPAVGSRMNFDSEQWSFHALPPQTERVIFAFFSPTCSLCGPLIPGLRRLHAEMSSREALALVSDTTRQRAEQYLSSKRAESLPLVAGDETFKENRIPGAPYIVVTDRAGAVAAAGGVNTLEQIELLVEEARLQTETTRIISEPGVAVLEGREEDASVI